ncbi:mitochondrial carrier domain-containing protein [Ochromonadaceae sp. CCMP2298]|nr:mitochondrial carrier domain-containing protein [Ochromonadaceae sp. CCMP2298]
MPSDVWCVSDMCGDEEGGGPCTTLRSIRDDALSRQLLASSLGSVVSTLSLNPINVLKVRLQSGEEGVIEVAKRILRVEGVGGFWAGMRTGLAMSIPNTVLYMSAYENLKLALQRGQYSPPAVSVSSPNYRSTSASSSTSTSTSITAATVSSSLRSLYYAATPAVAGALARMLAVTLISPLELVRTIQTAGTGGGASGSVFSIGGEIVRRYGVGGLYRGWAPSIMRDCPFSAIYWLGFESLRPLYAQAIDGRSIDGGAGGTGKRGITSNARYSALSTFLSGATSGAAAAVCTHPFDVLKTQQQVAVWSDTSPSQQHCTPWTRFVTGCKCSTPALQSVRTLYMAGGMQVLFRGLTMRLATVIPASAIMVTVYEAIKTIDL